MAPVALAVSDNSSKNNLTAVDKLIRFCGGIQIKSVKEQVPKCLFFLAVCLITHRFMGLNAIPHVIIFTYMLWAAARMMFPAFCNLASLDEDVKKRSGQLGFFKVFHCPFKAYSAFLILVFLTYILMGGNVKNTTWRNRVAYVSCCLEGFGLVSLLNKIRIRGHVRGVSGMSMMMFALTYSMREFEAFFIAHVNWINLNDIYLEVLQVSAMILSYMVLWAIFSTHRRSYEEDQDVLKGKYLIPGCLLVAMVLHPEFRRGSIYSMSWAASFYIDVLALLPQVVMMQRGGGIVEAPIAHFVAATAVSRSFDLLFWWDRWHRGDLVKYLFDANVSAWIIVFFHLVSFALVADFMYFYFKWRFSGEQTCDTIMEISVDEDA